MKKIFTLIVAITFFNCSFSQIWTAQDVGYGQKTLGMRDLTIVDSNIVWITSYDGFQPFVVNRLEFSRTLDGGNTWIPGVINSDLTLTTSSLNAISATEAWVSMYDVNVGVGGGIYHTTDGGLTWPKSGGNTILDSNSFVDFLTFKDQLNGVAVCDPNKGYFEIVKTMNAGNNWTRIDSSKIPLPLANEFGTLAFAAQKNYIWFGTSKGRVLYSKDFGSTWSASTVFTGNDFFNRIAFRDTLNGLAIVIKASGATTLYATANGGANWNLVSVSGKLKPGSLCVVPGTNNYISCAQGTANVRGTSISNDDGKTWIELEATDSRGTNAFLNSTTGWSGGFSGPGQAGGIFKYNGLALGIDSKNNNTPNLSIYPTIVTDLLNVQISNLKSKNASIHISNILGIEMYKNELFYKNKAENLSLNLSDYSDGIYLITVKDGSATTTKKVVKKK